MAKKPKTIVLPAMQHVARLWRPTPELVRRGVVRLAKGIPPITYAPLYKLLYQSIQFRDPVEQLIRCVERIEKRPQYQGDFAQILNLTDKHVSALGDAKVSTVSHDNFALGRGLFVPFKPTLVLAFPNREVLPWLLPWKRQALNDEQIALLSEMIQSRMEQRPDLESVELEFWEYSQPKGATSKARELTILPANNISRLSWAELNEKLEIFAEGFVVANEQLAAEKRREQREQEQQPSVQHEHRQTRLFK